MEDELRLELARERSANADLEDIIRSHWNTIVDLRRQAERLQATLDRVTALVDEWQAAADYAREAQAYYEYAEEIEHYTHRLRDTVTPPNKE